MQLASLLAFLAPSSIPPLVLVENALFLPEPLRSTVTHQASFEEAILALLRFSLVSREGERLSLNAVVQAVIREGMHDNARRKFAEVAVALLDAALPDFPYGAWNADVAMTHDSLDQHALAAATHAEGLNVALDTAARLFGKVGFSERIRGNLAEAKDCFGRALAIGEKIFGPDHPNVAAYVNNVGMVLRDMGDLDGARACFERALAIGEKTFGPDHPDVVVGVSNLGSVLRERGDLDGARAAFERTLAIDEKVLGADHPNVAVDVNNLGMVLMDVGDVIGAKAAFERALFIAEKAFGPDHPLVADLLRDIAWHSGKRVTPKARSLPSTAAYHCTERGQIVTR